MSAIGGVEPLLPTAGFEARLDLRHDSARRRDLARTGEHGLARLLGHSSLPIDGQAALKDGLWTPPGPKGLYLVREKFIEASTIERTRWCVVGAYDPSSDLYRPIVTSARASVDETAEELQRAGVDPVGVVALYRDEEQRIDTLVADRGAVQPLIEQVSDDFQCAMWCLTNEESESVAALLAELGGAIVGDISLYRALVRSRDTAWISPDARPTLRFYNQRDFGVSFQGQSRAYSGLGSIAPNEVSAALRAAGLDVSEVRIPSDPTERESISRALVERVRNDGVTRRTTALVFPGVDSALVVSAAAQAVNLVRHENPPEIAAEFDVEWIEKGILRRITDVLELELPRVHTPDRFFDLRSAPGTDLVFLVNPPPKRFLVDLGAESYRLPVESLQFSPVAARGLMLVPLERSKNAQATTGPIDIDA